MRELILFRLYGSSLAFCKERIDEASVSKLKRHFPVDNELYFVSEDGNELRFTRNHIVSDSDRDNAKYDAMQVLLPYIEMLLREKYHFEPMYPDECDRYR